MAWDKGFNFRTTAGFVTDGANETYVTQFDIYPVVRNGVNFGWTVAPAGDRDRLVLDRRLSGICFGSGSGTFQVDLPSPGLYQIHLAMGDAGGAQTASKITIKDNATTVLTIGPHDTISVQYYDATDVNRTDTGWTASEQGVNCSFSTTKLTLNLEVAASNSVIAHLRVVQLNGYEVPGYRHVEVGNGMSRSDSAT